MGGQHSWPKRIKADPTPRPLFHHVIDIVPTIYELTKITPPREVNGFKQDPIAGVSMVYTFADSVARGTRKTQFFDIMASRGIYDNGWFANAPGPREPWVGGVPKGINEWSPLTDKWELYNVDEGLEPGERPGCQQSKDGFLNYESNLFEVQRTKIRSSAKLPTGKVKIEVESKLVGAIHL